MINICWEIVDGKVNSLICLVQFLISAAICCVAISKPIPLSQSPTVCFPASSSLVLSLLGYSQLSTCWSNNCIVRSLFQLLALKYDQLMSL